MIENNVDRAVAPAGTTRRKTGLAVAMTALVAAALLLGGCGSDAKADKSVASVETSTAPAAAGPSGEPGAGSNLAYAKCMREKGIADFPDPDMSGMIQLDGNKVDTNGAQFKAADTACKPLLPPQGQDTLDRAKIQKASLDYAKCMREKGVTKFPDPNAQGGFELDGNNLGVEPDGKIFKDADAACKPIMEAAVGKVIQSDPKEIGPGGGGGGTQG